MVINSCRCDEMPQEKGSAAFAAVTRYLDAGGRIFNTHFSYDFLKYSPDPLLSAAVAPDKPSPTPGPALLDTSFPKGKALADWIKFLDPSAVFGQIPIATTNFGFLTGANSQIWARASGPRRPAGPAAAQGAVFVTINTPVSASPDKQCGRVVHMDTHVTSSAMEPRPEEVVSLSDCQKDLNKAEHVLAFMLFDLAACIQEDTKPPAPPPVVVD